MNGTRTSCSPTAPTIGRTASCRALSVGALSAVVLSVGGLSAGGAAAVEASPTTAGSAAAAAAPVWQKLAPARQPSPARAGGTVAEAPAGAGLLLHGGQRRCEVFSCGEWGPTPYQDTWLWNGSTWTQATGPAPSSQASNSIALSRSMGRTVMYGGAYGVGPYSDRTYLFNGTGWTQASLSPNPGRRASAVLAQDRTGRLVLFGGADYVVRSNGADGPVLYTDTWSYSAAGWQLLRPAHSPAPRAGAVAAYDSGRGELVVFGGARQVPGSFEWKRNAQTWVWDGTDWQRRTPATSPPAEYGTMTYDRRLGRVVLLTASRQTWTWDGTTWRREPGTGPPFGQMGYDPVSRRTVLLAARTAADGSVVNSTWAFG